MKRGVGLLMVAVGLTGCASIQATQRRSTEQLLAEAGFEIRTADTPGARAYLDTLPAGKMLTRSENGKTEYVCRLGGMHVPLPGDRAAVPGVPEAPAGAGGRDRAAVRRRDPGRLLWSLGRHLAATVAVSGHAGTQLDGLGTVSMSLMSLVGASHSCKSATSHRCVRADRKPSAGKPVYPSLGIGAARDAP